MNTNVVPLKSGQQISAIVPTTIEEVFRLATAIAKSGLAPKGMTTPEAITIAIMHGMEIGLPPLQAVQRIAVVNGRPTIWGDALPALLWARGFKIEESIGGELDARCATCRIIRPDGNVIERKFSVGDARRAGLWGKAGPWAQYPDRMLQMRARGFAARDGAADVLSGLYLAEEIEDARMKDITPARTVEPLPDIPDVPDVDPVAADDVPEPLADPQGVLLKLEEDIRLCESAEELSELAEHNATLIERLPPGAKRIALKMLQNAAE